MNFFCLSENEIVDRWLWGCIPHPVWELSPSVWRCRSEKGRETAGFAHVEAGEVIWHGVRVMKGEYAAVPMGRRRQNETVRRLETLNEGRRWE
jgi:hypothetical protein